MITEKYLKRFGELRTPFYFYDMDLLERTIKIVKKESDRYGFNVHYAIKANANPVILKKIVSFGFGSDCVSGNEILRSLECGFPAHKIAFAGVGKSNDEILTGLRSDIFSFNVESLPELEVIDQLAGKEKRVARIALRINPNVEAFTHKYITTGIEESKFGINMWDLQPIIDFLGSAKNISLTGLHFHIGSQIKRFTPFKALCVKINEIQEWFNNRNIFPGHINVGGGLGIDYENPDDLPDFAGYFSLFDELLEQRKGQQVHFELGRSLVGQAGSLITRVLYIKNGLQSDFVIVDAGMTDLIRPALYQAYHKIDNLTSVSTQNSKYNIVGPICESTDSFGKFIDLPETQRGDLLAIRSAGAYGEVMISNYNLRDKPGLVCSDNI